MSDDSQSGSWRKAGLGRVYSADDSRSTSSRNSYPEPGQSPVLNRARGLTTRSSLNSTDYPAYQGLLLRSTSVNRLGLPPTSPIIPKKTNQDYLKAKKLAEKLDNSINDILGNCDSLQKDELQAMLRQMIIKLDTR